MTVTKITDTADKTKHPWLVLPRIPMHAVVPSSSVFYVRKESILFVAALISKSKWDLSNTSANLVTLLHIFSRILKNILMNLGTMSLRTFLMLRKKSYTCRRNVGMKRTIPLTLRWHSFSISLIHQTNIIQEISPRFPLQKIWDRTHFCLFICWSRNWKT